MRELPLAPAPAPCNAWAEPLIGAEAGTGGWLLAAPGTPLGLAGSVCVDSSLREARTLAEQRGLDLMEVAPNAVPPVCRIVDYGKFRYEQTKKDREARKNQKQAELKEVRLKPKTDDHDLEVKSKQARKFLLAGDKVKFTVRFRGREIFHPDIGREMLEQMAEDLRDVATVEQKPLMEGRALSLLLAPNAKAKAQRERELARAQRSAQAAGPHQTQAPVEPDEDDDIDDADDDDEDEEE